MTEYIIPAAAGIVVAVIEALAARDRMKAKKDRERAEARYALREEESRLSMQMADATLQLSIVTANALTGGRNNGNVERARQAAAKAEAEYEAFHNRLAAHEVTKF